MKIIFLRQYFFLLSEFYGFLFTHFGKNDTISKIIGKESGFIGVILASLIGSITLIPGFVAFPTAAMLLKSGAGYIQIAAFISTLMMVGIVTFPVEIKYFGKKLTILRNLTAFVRHFIQFRVFVQSDVKTKLSRHGSASTCLTVVKRLLFPAERFACSRDCPPWRRQCQLIGFTILHPQNSAATVVPSCPFRRMKHA